MSLSVIDCPSPNFNERGGIKPSLVILHYTDMLSAQDALDRMCDVEANVSAHYMIEENGRIHSLVDEDKRAYHAGVSFWNGEKDINAHSIGIELCNPGHSNGYRAFPVQQMQALVELLRDIHTRHDIPDYNILAHSDVAPNRKIDPGELFDWKMLASRNLGLWPQPEAGDDKEATLFLMNEARLRQAFVAYGYDGKHDLATLVSAFQRHFYPEIFRQSALVGIPDHETALRLAALVRQKNATKLVN